MDNENDKIWNSFIIERTSPTDFGCLMVYLTEEDQNYVQKFIDKYIPDEKCHEEGKDGDHITIMYGFHPDIDVANITKFIQKKCKQPLKVKLGKISRFDSDEYDVLKIEVESEDLHNLHNEIKEYYGDKITNSYPNYNPHLTLAYLKKGELLHLDNNNMFNGKKYVFDEFIFSEPGMKKKYKIFK